MKTKQLWLLLCIWYAFALPVNAIAMQSYEPVLLWLVVDNGSSTEFLDGDLHQSDIEQLRLSAQARGITLLFPMLDLNDRQALQERDVAKFNWDRIAAASIRYNNPSVLAGKLTRKNDGWVCQWQLQDAQRSMSWVATGKDWTEQFTMIAERLAGTAQVPTQQGAQVAESTNELNSTDLAQEPSQKSLSQNSSGTQIVKIRVSGVNSIDAYSKIQAYLESLAMVVRVELNGLLADEASFTINTDADKLSLAEAIAQDNVLREINDTNSNSEYLEYRQS